jgi:hypothetical protein
MKTIKRLLLYLVILLLVGAGAWFWGFNTSQEEESYHEATVLVEQVRSVSKVVAIEATLSEIYEYRDFWGYDFKPFRKKALIRVKANVSVGYDLENLIIHADPEERTIRISYPEDPKILAIDQDLDYYDLSEGWLNSFDEKSLSDLQSKARTFIEQKVRESDLYDQAEHQKKKWLEGLSSIVQLAGWKLETDHKPSKRIFTG